MWVLVLCTVTAIVRDPKKDVNENSRSQDPLVHLKNNNEHIFLSNYLKYLFCTLSIMNGFAAENLSLFSAVHAPSIARPGDLLSRRS